MTHPPFNGECTVPIYGNYKNGTNTDMSAPVELFEAKEVNAGSIVTIYDLAGRLLGSFFYGYIHDESMHKLSDGRFECSFRMWPLYPYAWANQTSKLVQGKAHGISNADNTKMDIEVIYSTLEGFVLDTAFLYLYKE